MTEKNVIENLPSKTLLESIVIEWTKATNSLRDSYITIGKLLHQYILLRLQEGDTLTESERLSDSITREAFTEDAASRLSISVEKVNELINSAMVVELLSDNIPLDSISYSAIREFRSVVMRVKIGRGAKDKKRVGIKYSKEIEVQACREQWVIREPYKSWAVDLFQRAIRDRLSSDDVRLEIARLKGKEVGDSTKLKRSHKAKDPFNTISKTKSTTHIPKPTDPVDSHVKSRKCMLYEIGRVGSPRDVKDTILQMIVNSEDPRSLAKMVMSELGNLLEYNNKPNLFNVG